MKTITRPEIDRSAPASADAKPVARRVAAVSRTRNRRLAIALAGVAVTAFAIAILLGLLFHYAEAHHAFPHF
jgi:hypothetical protein